ncbi:MAG: PspC domain-containing protein [Bacteroidales bacterium]|nr:PspC domain-containing protein [Bacteroidales bacterium]
MKKTFSVNLGNMVYNIDEDAYMLLKEYLERIEVYFSDEKDREDIMDDIEGRISELFSENLGTGKQVITFKDVEKVIAIMGDPQEISGGVENNHKKVFTEDFYKRPRRLYRDPDNRIIGGVSGGLGAYLNIDPVVIRILFVIFFFIGFGLLIYIVMWIVVPEARTTAQKLEMRGDPVNVSNIGKFVKDEFESVKNSFRRKDK